MENDFLKLLSYEEKNQGMQQKYVGKKLLQVYIRQIISNRYYIAFLCYVVFMVFITYLNYNLLKFLFKI
jgi:hypothetical protein